MSAWKANKGLVLTPPAHGNFDMIARHKGLGGNSGFVLPHTARERPHNTGVGRPLRYKFGVGIIGK